MRLKIYLCGVYKNRDMIGRKVICLSYLFNKHMHYFVVLCYFCVTVT